MKITIRQEEERDYKLSERVVEEAFKNAEHTDHKEHILVANLRKGDNFIEELSLVAEQGGKIVGHIMFTKIFINNGENIYESLALAPLSVLPEYQSRGIGSSLINEGLRIAREMDFKSVIVLGHDKYYPKFGFKPASLWGIKAPFEVPDEVFMALELEDRVLEETSGQVIYGKEFLE